MIRLIIRTLPPSINKLERMNYHVKKRLRKHFADEIFYAWWESGDAVKQGPRRMRLSTTIYWKTRRLDEDNAMGSLKILIDAMRDIGLIYRDSPRWLEVNKPFQKLDRKDPRVEIELEQIAVPKKELIARVGERNRSGEVL